jgi:hypothetical protein
VIEANIYSVLAADPGIAALAGTRIYPIELPEGPTLPALTYKMIYGLPKPTFSTSGMKRSRVQIDSRGSSYGDAVTLRQAVIVALDGYVDANINVQLCGWHDGFEDDARIYVACAEFYFYFGS